MIPPALLRSETVLQRAREELAAERRRLDDAGVGGDLRLVGGTSMPGLLTHGDVDLLLRVEAAAFRSVTAQVRRLHAPRREDLWSAEMSLFLVDRALPVELAVVPVGSAQDVHFVRAWERLAASAELRAQYNALKTGPLEGYEARKAAFFTAITT